MRGKPSAFIEQVTRNEINAAGKEGVEFELEEDEVEIFKTGRWTYHIKDYSYPVMEKMTHVIRCCADDGKVNVLLTVHYREGQKEAALKKLKAFISEE